MTECTNEDYLYYYLDYSVVVHGAQFCPLPPHTPDILSLCFAPHCALLTLPAAIPVTRNPRRGRAGAGAAGGGAGGHLPGDG
jgi:hypothetical protein